MVWADDSGQDVRWSSSLVHAPGRDIGSEKGIRSEAFL